MRKEQGKIFIVKDKTEKPKLISSPLHLVISLVIFVFLLIFIQSFIFKTYRIPSESMQPTIDPGERVIVDRLAYRFSEPKKGDIVVFKAPKEEALRDSCKDFVYSKGCSIPGSKGDVNYIKRVLATPGDRFKVINGEVIINDKKVFSRFKNSCENKAPSCNLPKEITLKKDQYYLIGDNRGNSFDSRSWGPVPRDWIIGKARVTYWPLDKIGIF